MKNGFDFKNSSIGDILGTSKPFYSSFSSEPPHDLATNQAAPSVGLSSDSSFYTGDLIERVSQSIEERRVQNFNTGFSTSISFFQNMTRELLEVLGGRRELEPEAETSVHPSSNDSLSFITSGITYSSASYQPDTLTGITTHSSPLAGEVTNRDVTGNGISGTLSLPPDPYVSGPTRQAPIASDRNPDPISDLTRQVPDLGPTYPVPEVSVSGPTRRISDAVTADVLIPGPTRRIPDAVTADVLISGPTRRIADAVTVEPARQDALLARKLLFPTLSVG